MKMAKEKKKRLLFVNGHLNVGGVEKSLVDLLRHLDYSKYDVDLLLLQDLGDYYSELPKDVNVLYRNINQAYGALLPSLFGNLINGRWRELMFRLALMTSSVFGDSALKMVALPLGITKKYDCAIAYRVDICERIVAHVVRSRRKLLWWHHGECNYTEKQIVQANSTWKYFDHVVTVSEGCMKMLQDKFSYPAKQYVVIPNLIDIERINQMAGGISPYSESPDTLIMVTVGRLSQEKHIDNVPLAARLLIEKGITQFRWFVVGDGDEREHIECVIREQRVSDQVVLLGAKTNPYPYIKYANILVHTSYVESQSITVLEAMALKTPCVVCKSLGPMEFMEDGKNGMLVGQGAEELSNGICSIVKSPNMDDFVFAGFKVVKERFSSETVLAMFSTLIR